MEKIKELNRNQKQKRIRKKMVAIIGIVILVVISMVIIVHMYIDRQNQISNWKENAITSPIAGSLQAAGNITISWESAEEIGEVKEYKLYVDEELAATTDADTRTYEYYGVKVKGYEAYVEADMTDGSKIYSNIFTFYVNKKGFCMNKDMAQTINAADWGVSWYYNWAMEAFKYTSFQSLQYVPMMWASYETDSVTSKRFPKRGYKYMLTYNEPDRTDQANISVENAVEGMKAFKDLDITIGSPATALCPPWSKEWFQPFMEQLNAQNMDVDFIAVHHYWNWYQEEGIQAFLDLIDETYEMYHKPIWITEFALSGNPGKNEEQLASVENYMKGIIEGLDERDYVERYAWFSFSPGDYRNAASALLQTYTGEITSLGKLYQEIGMPEGYGDESILCNKENPKNNEK